MKKCETQKNYVINWWKHISEDTFNEIVVFRTWKCEKKYNSKKFLSKLVHELCYLIKVFTTTLTTVEEISKKKSRQHTARFLRR